MLISLGMAVAALLIVGLFFFWRARLRMQQWSRLMKGAQEASTRGDWVGAERSLTQACEFAAGKNTAMMNTVALISKRQLAGVLFRAGQLDRAADVSFEMIQAMKGPG